MEDVHCLIDPIYACNLGLGLHLKATIKAKIVWRKRLYGKLLLLSDVQYKFIFIDNCDGHHKVLLARYDTA